MKTIEEFTEKGKISDFRILATDKFLMQYFSENNFPMKIPTLGAPNMATDFTYQNMSITSLMSNLAIVSQNLFELNNDALKNIRSTYEYNFLMLNSEDITTALQDFCNSITKILLYEDNNNNTIVITISVIIGSYSTLIIIYLITTNLIINTKKKIIGIFAKIPKDVVGNQFHILEKQTNQKSTSHTRSIFNFSRKMVIIVCVVASLTILSMAVSFYEAFKAAYENNVAVEKTQYVTQVLSSTSHQQANILAWTFDNFSQTTQNMALRKQILLEQQNLEKSWTLLRFGTLEGICTNTSANCEPGLDTLMESYALSVNALFYSNSTTLLQPLTSQLIELSGYIFKSMNHISDVILQSTIGLRVPISVAVSCTGIALIIVLSIFHFSQLEQQAEENYHLRRLLNSLPTDTISQIEEIKKFVLYNSLAERKKDSHKASKVQVILDGSNDGAIVLKPKSTMIDIINSTALKMLGYNSGELLDLMAIFGEGESRSKLSMILEVFFSSKQSLSEYIEMEALRKNGSTLAVGVSISVYTYENKNLITVLLRDITSEKKHKLLLEEERQKSDALLLNILPERIASRLKAGESCISEKFDDISCLFSDMVGFTKMSSGLSAHELVQLLNAIINGFDHLIPMFGLEKIKDAYFCIGGISGQSNHPEQIILFALHMLDVIAKYNKQNNKSLNVRIGLHVGPIIAGCIGNLKFAYDLWGETLNIAQAMESKGFPGRIQVSRKMYERVYDIFEFDEIKGVEIKPSVVMTTYLLKEKHHDIASFHVGSDQSFEKMFSKVNLHEPTSYNFKKLIMDSTFTSLYKEYLSGSAFLDMLVFYQHAMEYTNNASTPVRFGISKQLVKEYLAETAPKRLKFKFMRNAFGPFQLKFQECTEDNCPTDLFENFTILCMKHLKEEFANFLKSNNFAKFLDQKRKNPESLKACLRGENDSSTTDEEDEKEFLLFCQKCGTEIINKENHRFNDWEFNHRSEILYDMNQWRKIFEISGGATYFSPPETHNHLSNSRRHVQVKYVYEMNCSHEELFYAWIDEDSFSTRFEKIISSVKIDFVKVAKYAHAVFHEIYKMKYLHQTKRELVHAYCCRYDPTKDVYMCVTRSINNAKVPETDKYVRAEIKTAFLVEKVTDSKCRYYYSVIFDPMGWLKPEYYHESIYKETPQNNFHMKLLKLVDKRSKEGRSIPKGPLFDSLTYYINQTQQEKKKKTLNITKEENVEDPQQVSV
ncbi:hypothetical protein C9374_007395 [Naegleria lovaniensis]|uniref:Uncharacterized protein n=1 Tax=Naegleria lovaniensis TaxID=51637 RepID=A0AA88KII8_NAELO|nr:uncharacterized protein C9374_007395 [Naegleria lovaniensis]KAG2379256.1 hypothetical protein C9374_007395 [Naegleria lovaniensis]